MLEALCAKWDHPVSGSLQANQLGMRLPTHLPSLWTRGWGGGASP